MTHHQGKPPNSTKFGSTSAGVVCLTTKVTYPQPNAYKLDSYGHPHKQARKFDKQKSAHQSARARTVHHFRGDQPSPLACASHLRVKQPQRVKPKITRQRAIQVCQAVLSWQQQKVLRQP